MQSLAARGCEEILNRHLTDQQFNTMKNLSYGDMCRRKGFKALERAGLIDLSPKKKRRDHFMSAKEKAEIVREAKALMTADPRADIGEIAHRNNIHVMTIRAWARAQGVSLKKGAIISIDLQDRAIKLINSGVSCEKACRQLGFSMMGLRRAIEKRGYKYKKKTKKICKK